MKRVNILYGGTQYSIGRADVDAIKRVIEESFSTGTARWITVNFGEGRPQPADLLVGPGIPISIIPVPADDAIPRDFRDTIGVGLLLEPDDVVVEPEDDD